MDKEPKEIKIEIDGKCATISTLEKIIIITDYQEECIMTINYPKDWGYTRAMQHATSILTIYIV